MKAIFGLEVQINPVYVQYINSTFLLGCGSDYRRWCTLGKEGVPAVALSNFVESRPNKREYQAHVVSHEKRCPRHLVLQGEFPIRFVSLVEVDVFLDQKILRTGQIRGFFPYIYTPSNHPLNDAGNENPQE